MIEAPSLTLRCDVNALTGPVDTVLGTNAVESQLYPPDVVERAFTGLRIRSGISLTSPGEVKAIYSESLVGNVAVQ